MNVQNQITELLKGVRTRPEKLRSEKVKGKKLIGYNGRFMPEELIYAAGATPYLICRGGEPEPTEAVLPYMLRFVSPFARAQIGHYLLGVDPVLPMLDLIVAQCDDCHMSRLGDLFEYFKLPTARLGIPPDWEKGLSFDYYRKGLERLKGKLEELTGNTVTEGKLKEAIESLNALRGLLQELSVLRKQQPPPLGGYDLIRLNHYSFYAEPESVISELTNLHAQIREASSPFSERAPRILLAGHVVAVGDYVVPKLIEDSGGVIVTESLDEGLRHAQWKVSTHGDLMRNLAATYFLERTPPSIFQPAWKKRGECLRQLVSDFAVDGVVWYQLSFEEIYDMEGSIVSKSMEEMKVPLLKLESSYEYAREAMGPLTTRVESFIEALKTRRK